MKFIIHLHEGKHQPGEWEFLVVVHHDGERHTFGGKTMSKAIDLVSLFLKEKWRQENA